MRRHISHFSWPDTALCEVPSKPTLAKAKGVGQYTYVFLRKHVRMQYLCLNLTCQKAEKKSFIFVH